MVIALAHLAIISTIFGCFPKAFLVTLHGVQCDQTMTERIRQIFGQRLEINNAI
jgi:hypothetical protein